MSQTGMLLHPVLHKPELTTAAADIILTGWVEDAHVEPTREKLPGEILSKITLMLIPRW
jgi:hypothetical protein